MIGKLKESFEWLKYISPFDYFVPSNIMKNGFELKYIIISVCIIVICVISSYAIYKNKDMNI